MYGHQEHKGAQLWLMINPRSTREHKGAGGG